MIQVLDLYGDLSYRTILASAGIQGKTITLRPPTKLLPEDTLTCLELMLRLHGVELIFVGEHFVEAVPVGTGGRILRAEGRADKAVDE